jgi:hypothetical protein
MAVVFLALCALEKLGRQFPELLWDPRRFGAVDLRLRYRDVHGWFAGDPVYRTLPFAS